MAKEKVKEAKDGEGEAPADGTDGEGATAKKKLPLKMLIIAGAAALVVLGGHARGGGAERLHRSLSLFLLDPAHALDGAARQVGL